MSDHDLTPWPPAATESRQREEVDFLLAGPVDPETHTGRILRYLADAHFEGRGDTVKEFLIAVDVLGRSPQFDPKVDSIVRVEIHKLRRFLREYYEGPGKHRPLRVLLPPKGYRLQFDDPSRPGLPAPWPAGIGATQRDAGVAGFDGPPVASSVPQQRHVIWLLVAITALVVAFTIWQPWARDAELERAAAFSAPRIDGAAALPNPHIIRISVGAATPVIDRVGREWAADVFFEGGRTAKITNPATVAFTRAAEVYATRREGDFVYRIPVAPGHYEVKLHFAEGQYGETKTAGGGETSRAFQVLLNGALVENPLDIAAAAGGPDIALVRVYPGVVPSEEGTITIHLKSLGNEKAILNGIEVAPGLPDRQQPLRMVAGTRRYIDDSGRVWEPEDYYTGGRLTDRQNEVAGGPGKGIFLTERFGNFSYRLPVAAGHSYTLTVHAAEQFFGVMSGQNRSTWRRFDVMANGLMLAREVDIHQAAGGPLRAHQLVFRGLKGNAQGYLWLHFAPVQNYALLNALELVDEGKAR